MEILNKFIILLLIKLWGQVRVLLGCAILKGPVIIAFHILVLAHLLYSVKQTHVQIAYKQSQFLCFLITINLE